MNRGFTRTAPHQNDRSYEDRDESRRKSFVVLTQDGKVVLKLDPELADCAASAIASVAFNNRRRRGKPTAVDYTFDGDNAEEYVIVFMDALMAMYVAKTLFNSRTPNKALLAAAHQLETEAWSMLSNSRNLDLLDFANNLRNEADAWLGDEVGDDNEKFVE